MKTAATNSGQGHDQDRTAAAEDQAMGDVEPTEARLLPSDNQIDS